MSETMNLRERFELLAKGERIEAVVVTNLTHGDHEKFPSRVSVDKLGKVVSWREAIPWLDYEIELGYGSSQEPYYDVTAWTPSRVIYTDSYDVKLEVHSQPRNPAPQETQAV